MALTCYSVPGKDKSKTICRAFEYGAPKSAKGAVFFGTEGVMHAFQAAKREGHWWYIDNSYFDKHRGTYFRVTKNALQVDPRGRTSTGERFAKLNVKIHPWRETLGDTVLVCPQSDNFMKSTLGREGDWARDTVEQLQAWGIPGPIQVRPWNRDKVKANETLHQMLPRVRLLISHSSSASITAMLEGVPSLSTGETAAAYHLTGPMTQEAVFNPPRPSTEERLRFCQILADSMFTLEEFRDGTAWRWLEKA